MEARKLLTACAGLVLLATPALAGPTWKFGPNDEGTARLDYLGQFSFQARDTGSGEDSDDSTFEFNFRRNRLALIGAWGEHLGVYVQTEYREDVNLGPLGVSDGDDSKLEILDAQIRLTLNDALNVTLGKFKYNFTRENLEACFDPLTLDRSLFGRAPLVEEGTRDKGVAIWGNVAGGLFQYRVDAMNGRNDSKSAPKSALRYSARAHVSLLDPESAYGYKGTYLGKKKVLTLGGAYQMEKDVVYADTVNKTDAKDYKAWTVDGFFEYPIPSVGTVTASAAYANYDIDDAYQGANPDADAIGLYGEKKGGYAKAAYLLPNLPLQLYLRGEQWRFANLNGFYDQKVKWYAIGANYFFRGQNLRLTLDYSKTDFDEEGTVGSVTTENFGTFTTQLQLIF